MTSKVIIIALASTIVRGGIIPVEEDPFVEEGNTDNRDLYLLGHGHASSYMHFHGPVEAPVYEVKLPFPVPFNSPSPSPGERVHFTDEDHHRGYSLDYVARPKYEFSYGVEDHRTGDFHGQKETRDGKTVKGEYSVKEPSGNVRTVSYHADEDGFRAIVRNSKSNDHVGGTYAGREHLESREMMEQPTESTPVQRYETYYQNEENQEYL